MLNFTNYVKKIESNLMKDWKKIVKKVNKLVYSDIKQFSPIDTWNYTSWHKDKGVIQKGNKIIWTIENVWDYPEKVEKGWRKTAVNWHTPAWIYFNKWANTYERAVLNNKKYFNKLLKWK